VVQAVHAQALGYFHKQFPVVDVYYLPGRYLGHVEGQAKYGSIRLAEMHVAGRNESVEEIGQAELPDAEVVDFPAFIVDGYQLQPVLMFEFVH
jgi:hypothetical protein